MTDKIGLANRFKEERAVGYREGREESRAEIERLQAERDLWKARAERMFWLLPGKVRVAQIKDMPDIPHDSGEEIERLKNELAEKNQFLDQLVETLSRIRPDAFANRRAD